MPAAGPPLPPEQPHQDHEQPHPSEQADQIVSIRQICTQGR